ncbi:MAG: hypothetical protein HQM15_01340 [Deltaproteobacteria bacterium]|nr:hypothetical protein [Deltaproteobacteria bacterium]
MSAPISNSRDLSFAQTAQIFLDHHLSDACEGFTHEAREALQHCATSEFAMTLLANFAAGVLAGAAGRLCSRGVLSTGLRVLGDSRTGVEFERVALRQLFQSRAMSLLALRLVAGGSNYFGNAVVFNWLMGHGCNILDTVRTATDFALMRPGSLLSHHLLKQVSPLPLRLFADFLFGGINFCFSSATRVALENLVHPTHDTFAAHVSVRQILEGGAMHLGNRAAEWGLAPLGVFASTAPALSKEESGPRTRVVEGKTRVEAREITTSSKEFRRADPLEVEQYLDTVLNQVLRRNSSLKNSVELLRRIFKTHNLFSVHLLQDCSQEQVAEFIDRLALDLSHSRSCNYADLFEHIFFTLTDYYPDIQGESEVFFEHFLSIVRAHQEENPYQPLLALDRVQRVFDEEFGTETANFPSPPRIRARRPPIMIIEDLSRHATWFEDVSAHARWIDLEIERGIEEIEIALRRVTTLARPS